MRLAELRAGLAVILTLLTWLLPNVSYAQVGSGSLDVSRYDASNQVLLVSGWAAPETPNVYTSNILVSVGGKQVYKGRFFRFERPDVAISRHRPDWLWSGWQVETNIPGLPPGHQEIRVRFVLTDGQTFEVPSLESARFAEVPIQQSPSNIALLLVATAVLLPMLGFVAPQILVYRAGSVRQQKTVFAASVVASFLCLLASGFSGSSVRLALKDSPLLVHNAVPWHGDARGIRSDEWNILTQMAIGQVNAPKQFPVVNTNVGIDGNNMLLIGMTGVPVSHISSLAKPATWGFWGFDMRRALAWHWWLPFFGCFLALWAFMMQFFHLNWQSAAILSISVTASPYSVVFSGHPAYTVFFLTLSMYVLDVILKTTQRTWSLALGFVLGISLAGFVLVLYLPWQITLMYLMLPLVLAHWMTHRQSWFFRGPQIGSLMVAVLVFATLLGSWLIDTVDVLRTVSATVYPGQRATSVGGDIDPWFLIKGLMTPLTLYHESPMMSASDAGSFIWIWIPLMTATGIVCLNDRKVHPVPAAVMGFMTLALAYIHLGFPRSLAEITLWGRVTSYRLDLALGLAQCLLLAWLFSTKDRALERIQGRTLTMVALAVGLLCFALAIFQFSLLPAQIAQTLTPGFITIASLLMGAVAYLVIMRRFEWATGIFCVWMLGAASMFNPLDQSPEQVHLDPRLKLAIENEGNQNIPTRLAVLDVHRWTMNLVAAGIPTVNAVLYHPQPSLWQHLDPAGAYKTQYNRYQNLEFATKNLSSDMTHQIDAPSLDRVRVTLDPIRFDFNQLGATHILTSPETATTLASNTSIRRVATTNQWAVMKVISP